jgi:hypothetical protein
VTIGACETNGSGGMHRRFVGAGVAGNTSGILSIHVGLRLPEQVMLLETGLGVRAPFKQQRNREGAKRDEQCGHHSFHISMSSCGDVGCLIHLARRYTYLSELEPNISEKCVHQFAAINIFQALAWNQSGSAGRDGDVFR